ncbi:MAG: hypothetical protein EP298_08845 [Gammaproteobacteria bacterium]|nr:MAG: hypothetical protein EP298_08845 [Gammaproteobacteria bacterium]UTW43144.1 hypothetical protein KFE69_03085 [bacterium SCSIO 12844]
MDELTLSIGYKMIESLIGRKYADVVYDIAATNNRNKVYIPVYSGGSTGRLKKALPDHIFKELVKHFGGQRLYIQKENIKIDESALRRKATQDLADKGYSADEIAQIIGVNRTTVFKSYLANKVKMKYLNGKQGELF